ncbi:MAG: transposase [Acidimicrobiales bacterium]
MRSIGLDVHRDFCEVAIWDGQQFSRHPRVPARQKDLEQFARSLRRSDQVALEATGNAQRVAEVLRPHVHKVVIANAAALKGVGLARAKTDRLDARTLAQLLAGGLLPTVWEGDEATRLARRRVSRREHLVKLRTQFKNQIHAALHRNLAERPPVTDLFGVGGRRWLEDQQLPADERDTIAGCLRQIDFLNTEIAELDRAIAEAALQSESVRGCSPCPA